MYLGTYLSVQPVCPQTPVEQNVPVNGIEYVLVAPETVALAMEPVVDVSQTVVPRLSAGGEDECCARVKDDQASTACVQLKRGMP